MSGSIASKNLYELLGNDPELDPERKQPEPPTKAIDKPAARSGKRNAGAEAPLKDARAAPAPRGGRQQFGGSEGAFRDRNAGSANNRGKPTEDGLRQDRTSNRPRGEQRGGRGGRGGPRRDDRHSRSGVSDHPKQVQQGWGGEDGNKELADEQAGEAIAKQEEDAAVGDAAEGDAADAAAEEEKVKSYDDYLAEIMEKKAALGGNVDVRKPNEGAAKKFPEGKPIEHVEEEVFFVGDGGKKGRERSKKEKNQLDLGDIYGRGEERGGFRGGRGGPRGGGRGGPREGGFRGEGRGRGGRGGRGGERGGAARGGTRVNLQDTSAFPSLGA
ncbi:telomere and ribosome associated protein [Diplodia corticola]|uniref:Telomere and ribosome associated protein n=1 Tax=Diplodia corticola TaxID=236234 RepID=A0A1J9R491_9PEZI|nr:telomere and ribosome associated protein [Diplodia corticola]OJD36270.1 telomere and ribosome associated protein [Diplodia corticola]